MRKVLAVELVSVDGVMESPEEWAFSYSNDETEEAKLGEGIRFFDHLGLGQIKLERTRVVEAPGVTHLRFRIVR